MKRDSDWHLFEQAVEAFLKALDPGATVQGNVRLPDRHTGFKRQRDVWIETTSMKLFPVRILVSCKRYARKLNSADIDAFNGELQSSNAHKGVIYSYSGFTVPAIKKSEVLGISCCKLYASEPPDLPSMLAFPNCYASYPEARMVLKGILTKGEMPDVWGDFIDRPALIEKETTKSVVDLIVETFKKNEQESVLEATRTGSIFPLSWMSELTIRTEDEHSIDLKIQLAERWVDYVAEVQAYLINGTYSLSDKTFVGSQTTPSIDTWGTSPGSGWTRIEKRPPTSGNCLHFTRGLGGTIRNAFDASLRQRKIDPAHFSS